MVNSKKAKEKWGRRIKRVPCFVLLCLCCRTVYRAGLRALPMASADGRIRVRDISECCLWLHNHGCCWGQGDVCVYGDCVCTALYHEHTKCVCVNCLCEFTCKILFSNCSRISVIQSLVNQKLFPLIVQHFINELTDEQHVWFSKSLLCPLRR